MRQESVTCDRIQIEVISKEWFDVNWRGHVISLTVRSTSVLESKSALASVRVKSMNTSEHAFISWGRIKSMHDCANSM